MKAHDGWNMTLAGTYQVGSGPVITATWAVPDSPIAPALGRNLSACPAAGACTATKSLQLIAPGTLYASYQNQLDLMMRRAVKPTPSIAWAPASSRARFSWTCRS